jgi:hypothetical protein
LEEKPRGGSVTANDRASLLAIIQLRTTVSPVADWFYDTFEVGETRHDPPKAPGGRGGP